MKAFKVMAIIFAIIGILNTFFPVARDHRSIDDLSQVEELKSSYGQLGAEALETAGIKDLPTASAYKTGMAIAIGLALVTLIGLILTFAKKPVVTLFGLGMIVLAIASVLVHPYVKPGLFGGVSPRSAALIQSVPAALAGLFMFLYGSKLKKSIAQ
jgi:hypothetical protein